MRHQRYDQHPGCPVEACAEIIGGKWKGPILFYLLEGKKRFGELRRLFPEVTQRTLTQQLRQLEKQGIVTRTVYPEAPPRVEYSMSELGQSLRPVIDMMKHWGTGYLQEHIPILTGSKAKSADGSMIRAAAAS
jgi:DNA-binding HxlR family transcriptional regulator